MTATTNRHPTLPARWEPEYVETRVREITARVFGYRPEEVPLDARLGQEIVGDSLDMVGYIMELEETFDVTISDQMAEEWFTHQPLTVRNLAAMVWQLRGTGRPDRGAWTRPRPAAPAAEAVPFTQLGGRLSARLARREAVRTARPKSRGASPVPAAHRRHALCRRARGRGPARQ